MKLEIVTPSGIIFSGEVEYFTARGENGDFAILKDHIPMVSAIKAGHVKVVGAKESYYFIESAIIEFRNNVGNIMAQTAIEGTSIEDVMHKYKEYQDNIKAQNGKNKVDYTELEKDLQKSIKQSKAGSL